MQPIGFDGLSGNAAFNVFAKKKTFKDREKHKTHKTRKKGEREIERERVRKREIH